MPASIHAFASSGLRRMAADQARRSEVTRSMCASRLFPTHAHSGNPLASVLIIAAEGHVVDEPRLSDTRGHDRCEIRLCHLCALESRSVDDREVVAFHFALG